MNQKVNIDWDGFKKIVLYETEMKVYLLILNLIK